MILGKKILKICPDVFTGKTFISYCCPILFPGQWFEETWIYTTCILGIYHENFNFYSPVIRFLIDSILFLYFLDDLPFESGMALQLWIPLTQG